MCPTGPEASGRDQDLINPRGIRGPSGSNGLGRWGACAAAALAGVAALLVLRSLVLEPVRIPTSSMAGTLLPGEHVLVEKLGRIVRPWQRGDVVLFRAPDSGTLSIKRVVGLPGQTVEIRDGLLYVDGHVVRERYATPDAIDSVYFGPRRVSRAEVFVLGDNRRNSRDSRAYGGVPVSKIEGRITAVLWPLGRAGGLG